MSEQELHPNNNLGIESIQGIQDLNDSNAERCVGGSFIINTTDLNNGVNFTSAPGRFLNVNDLRNINYLGIINTTPNGFNNGDGQGFTIRYLNGRNELIGTQRINTGQTAAIFGGNIPNLNERANHLHIIQDPAPQNNVFGQVVSI